MRNKNLLLAVAFIAFSVLCVALVASADKDKKVDNLEIQRKTIDLKTHQLKGAELQTKLETELKKDTKDQERIKQLETENQKFQRETQELQKQLQAKAEAKNKASRAVANAVAPKAAAAPARPAPVNNGGSGCEWLKGRLAANGVAAGDIPAAISIATRESGCRSSAVNPSSGACNVFQEYRCGKWGGLGNTDAHIRGADSYAKTRYGGWWKAYEFWNRSHWW